jgi:hypothetical protein
MYTVETCSASDDPADREYVAVGRYARAADAIAAAQALVEAHLSLALSAGKDAKQAVDDWQRSGEIPRIVVQGGGTPLHFDPLAFARARAPILQRRV